MKYTYLFLLAFVLIVYSCSKDSANTTPSLKFKSFTPEVVPINSGARVILEFTDKEGDLDTISIYKIRLNRQTTATIRDSLKFEVPGYDKQQSGEIYLDFDFQNHLISAINPPVSGNPPVAQPDTLLFKFVVQDKAGNKSDTITSSTIVIRR